MIGCIGTGVLGTARGILVMAEQSKQSQTKGGSKLTLQNHLSILHSAVKHYQDAGGVVEVQLRDQGKQTLIVLGGLDAGVLIKEGLFILADEPTD